MSSGKGYRVGMRGASKSGGRKDIRSRQKRKFTRGEKRAQHMMFEHQDAQSESNSISPLTILIRKKKNDKFRTNQEINQNKTLFQNIMAEFKGLEYYLNENLLKDADGMSSDEEDSMTQNEEETEEWESMDEEDWMEKYFPDEYQKMLDDESDEFDRIDAIQQNMD